MQRGVYELRILTAGGGPANILETRNMRRSTTSALVSSTTWLPCAMLLWFTSCLFWLKVALHVPQAKGSMALGL